MWGSVLLNLERPQDAKCCMNRDNDFKQLGLHLISYQVILVVLPDHQHDALGVGQLGVVHHVQALGGVLLVGLVVDQAGKVSLLAEELDHKELVPLVPGQREQEGVELFKSLLSFISISRIYWSSTTLTCISLKVCAGITAATASCNNLHSYPASHKS